MRQSKVVEPRPTVVHGPAPKRGASISAERYISSDWLADELANLFPSAWLFACLEADVADAGDYHVLNIGAESVLVCRASDGSLGAFYNVCQHRGARLVPNQAGFVSRFVCPYHGWTYADDGELVHVPDMERFANGVDCQAKSLRPVRAATWNGLVWVCMDEAAPPLLEYLGEVAELATPYNLAGMEVVADQTVTLACNWKAVFDNFGELYHVDHIHPQHELMFNCPQAQLHLFAEGHTSVVIDGHTVNPRFDIPDTPNRYLAHQLTTFGGDPDNYQGRVLEIRDDIQSLRRAAGPSLGWDYDAFSDERLSDIEQYNVFPNTMITVQPDDALIARARPHASDPNRCYWDMLTLHRYPDPEVAANAGVSYAPKDARGAPPEDRPQHEEFTQEDIIAGNKSMGATIDQDVHLIRDVQAGMHSRGFHAQTLNSDEARVQHFHDWLNHKLGVTG